MKALFAVYPPIVFHILLLLSFEHLTYYLFLNQWSFSYTDWSYQGVTQFLYQNFYAVNGVAVIIGGLLADRSKDIKVSMQWAASAMLLGSVLSSIEVELTTFLSVALVLGGAALFINLCYLHLAVLFPTADDYKDNAFMLLLLISPVINTVASLFNFLLFDLGSIYHFLLRAGIALILVLLVSRSRAIGYTLEEDTAEGAPHGSPPNPYILVFCTVINVLVWLAYGHLPAITSTESLYEIYDGTLVEVIHLAMLVLIAVMAVSLLRTAQVRSRQLFKLNIGMALFLGLALIELANRELQYYQLDAFTDLWPTLISLLLLFPILLSVITHVNILRRAGLWLGVLMGAPQIVFGILATMMLPPWLLPVVVIVLIIALLIWIKDNRALIERTLQLQEPNQEVPQEAPNEDPFDHLID